MGWYRKMADRRLSRNAIKESFDNLPMGICFVGRYGQIILSNQRMNALCFELLGRDLQDGILFWNQLKEGRLRDEVLRVSYGSRPVLICRDGQAWMFAKTELDFHDEPVSQIVASNVSSLHSTRLELLSAGRSLEEMKERLQEVGASMAQVTAMEERLASKERIHRDMGSILLKSRRVLDANECTEVPLLLQQWDGLLRLMKSMESPQLEDPVAILEKAAAALHIHLDIHGSWPQEAAPKDLALAVVSEALNNAVRHADASRLEVQMIQNNDFTCMEITNDGIQPGSVQEGGGLSTLRRRIENAGGRMQILCSPRYCLQVWIRNQKGQL